MSQTVDSAISMNPPAQIASVSLAAQRLGEGWTVAPIDDGLFIGGITFTHYLVRGTAERQQLLLSEGVMKALRYRRLVPGPVSTSS